MTTHARIDIRPFADSDAETCARMMASTDPWIRLGRGYDRCLEVVNNDGLERFVAAVEGRIGGFLILDMRGSITGYIRTVCVEVELRGAGVGSALLDHAEARVYRESPNVFLCVSAFNDGARRLYERRGYEVVGVFHDYVKRGEDEILMRKTTAPLDEFRRFTPSSR